MKNVPVKWYYFRPSSHSRSHHFSVIYSMSNFPALMQLQWKVRSKTSCCSWGHNHPLFHHRILKSLEIFELFIRHTFPSFFLFVFVVLSSDVFAVYYPQSDWYRVYILSLEHSREAHAQSSFNICSNPCSSCRLNGSYVWYFSSLLLLMRRFRCAPMSHTHLSFQCKKLSFCNAQMGNKIQDELKGSGGGVLACIIHDMLNGTFRFCSAWLHCLMIENNAFLPRKVTTHSSPRQSLWLVD